MRYFSEVGGHKMLIALQQMNRTKTMKALDATGESVDVEIPALTSRALHQISFTRPRRG